MNKNNFSFAVKILNDRLNLEKQYLTKFYEIRDRYPESVEANIKSCEYRMNEIMNCLEYLKTND